MREFPANFFLEEIPQDSLQLSTVGRELVSNIPPFAGLEKDVQSYKKMRNFVIARSFKNQECGFIQTPFLRELTSTMCFPEYFPLNPDYHPKNKVFRLSYLAEEQIVKLPRSVCPGWRRV